MGQEKSGVALMMALTLAIPLAAAPNDAATAVSGAPIKTQLDHITRKVEIRRAKGHRMARGHAKDDVPTFGRTSNGPPFGGQTQTPRRFAHVGLAQFAGRIRKP